MLNKASEIFYYANLKKRRTFLFADKTDLKSIKKIYRENDFEDF